MFQQAENCSQPLSPSALRFFYTSIEPKSELDHATRPNHTAGETLEAILEACLRRLKSWSKPSNWSAVDWADEIRHVASIAAWQATNDFDRSKGSKMSSFVRQRIMARALTRFRQEWAFSKHCSPDEMIEYSEPNRANSGGDACRGYNGARIQQKISPEETVHELVDSLPLSDFLLIKRLFWNGDTEAELALELGISQCALNKRKRKILLFLRDAF